MFGYILTNKDLLNEEEKKYYKYCYCGLCNALNKEHGISSKMTLNYDMTFLVVLLNEIYPDNYTLKNNICILHPWAKCGYLGGQLINYVSDMNVIISYYNLIDDWKDDHNIFAASYAKILEKEYKKIEKKYPEKMKKMKTAMDELNKIEKQNLLIPDKAADVCGELFGEIFAPINDDNFENLKEFGKSLGKFIYIMDACIDLKGDIKHNRYNPLIQSTKSEFDDMLNLLMADCLEQYRKLNIKNNIIENILYSGIWTKYEIYMKGAK